MTMEFIPITAFMLGLVGSVHCAVMCGGISGYLQQGQTKKTASSGLLVRPSIGPSVRLSFGLSAGRLCSYAIAGGIAAGLGGSIVGLIGEQLSRNVMQIFIDLFLILLGISLMGLWNGLSGIEKVGARFWKFISPLSSRVLPVTNLRRAFFAGALWGWLPCGLVYSALVLVMGSGDILLGAMSMIAFGLGTMPMLSVIGLFSHNLGNKGQTWMRKLTGIVVILFGIAMFTGLLMSGSGHH